jgi:menaquinone-dependent protoporphyrinogen oxidase
MNILIIYGTTEGQTRKIARFMGDVIRETGHTATVCDACDDPPPPDAFDAVIAGGSIHIGKYQSALTHFITEHIARLNQKPCAFFSVCLAIASDDVEEHHAAQKIMDDYLEQTGWKTLMRTQVAGALLYTQYDFFKRLIMKQISKKEGRTTDTSQDYEYTDWDAVRKFVMDFVGSI